MEEKKAPSAIPKLSLPRAPSSSGAGGMPQLPPKITPSGSGPKPSPTGSGPRPSPTASGPRPLPRPGGTQNGPIDGTKTVAFQPPPVRLSAKDLEDDKPKIPQRPLMPKGKLAMPTNAQDAGATIQVNPEDQQKIIAADIQHSGKTQTGEEIAGMPVPPPPRQTQSANDAAATVSVLPLTTEGTTTLQSPKPNASQRISVDPSTIILQSPKVAAPQPVHVDPETIVLQAPKPGATQAAPSDPNTIVLQAPKSGVTQAVGATQTLTTASGPIVTKSGRIMAKTVGLQAPPVMIKPGW